MAKQVIVIEYDGNKADDEVQSYGVLAFLSEIARRGTLVNAEINPVVHHFTESDMAMFAASATKKQKGVTIKVERQSKPKIVLDDDSKEKIVQFFSDLING